MRRNYGIDVMKGLAMMMVVAHHILMTLPNDGLINAPIGNLLVSSFHGFCYCAVDCFVMATGFIMCEKEWRASRIFRLWSQVVGYSVAMVIVAKLFFPTVAIGMRDWFHAFMPITFNRYWFVTQYVALFFTIPFLNKLIVVMDFKEHTRLVLTGLCLLSLSSVWSGSDLFAVKWGYTYVWFLYLYLLGAYSVRVKGCSRMPRKPIGMGLIVLGTVLSVGADVLGKYLTQRFGAGARFGELLWSYASPTMLLEAVGMVIVFSQLEVKRNSIRCLIGAIASRTFIVYVVHSNMVFQQMIGWKTIFHPILAGPVQIIAGAVLGAMGLYLLIVAFDMVRKMVVGYFIGHSSINRR